MTEIVTIVLPVFGLIAIGYAIAASRLLDRSIGDALAGFVFVVPIPVLVFRTLATADFGGASPWLMWGPYFAVVAVIWIAGSFIVRRGLGRDARAGLVAGVSSAYGNTVLVGIPLSIAAYGEPGLLALTLIMTIHLPVAMTAVAVLTPRAERRDGLRSAEPGLGPLLKSVTTNLLRNPIIIAVGLGIVWLVLDLPLGGLPAILVDRIADVAPTVALISLGMSLQRYGVHGQIRASVIVSVLKLLVMPAMVFVLTHYVIAMPTVWANVAVLAAACPTGVNAYLIASRLNAGQAMASSAITLSTGLAVLTSGLWLAILEWA